MRGVALKGMVTSHGGLRAGTMDGARAGVVENLRVCHSRSGRAIGRVLASHGVRNAQFGLAEF